MRRATGTLLFIIVLQGCKQPQKTASPPEISQAPKTEVPAGEVHEYKLVGDVVSVDATAKSAMIKNEDIPGFMSPMTMSYPVPETSDLEKLKAGDRITAIIYKRASDERYWVGQVEVQTKK